MDYLQYLKEIEAKHNVKIIVLNLIINGLPSIFSKLSLLHKKLFRRFKPYYKWITFNINIGVCYLYRNFKF